MPTLLSPTDSAAPNASIDTTGSSTIEAADVSLLLKKKKKRRREEAAENTGEIGEKRKKKKKKKRHTEEGTGTNASSVNGAAVQVDEIPVKNVQSQTSFQAFEPQIDPTLETPESHSAAAALLSAIVAAASGSRDSGASNRAQPQQPEPQYNHTLAHQNSPQESVNFPFMTYGYGQPPFIPSHPALQPSATESLLFPTGANFSLPDMNFGSNEDVLRALQALDMSKITSVLRNIGDGHAGPSDDSTTAQPPTPNVQAPPPHVLASPLVMGQTQVLIPDHRRTLGLPTPGIEQQSSPDHAHLLANKWLSTSKLAELVRTEGLVYKKGKFSTFEEEQLEDAIEKFRASRGLNEDQIQELIFPQSDKTRDNIFWTELTSAVPLRPIIAVYHHVRRTRHPLKKQGVWNAEEDAILEQAVVDHGQQWEKICPIVGRMPSDCRDRYRNHIVNKNIRVNGPWSKDEEDQLTRIVTDMTVSQGRDIDSDVFWGQVSELMGGKRGRQQCRIKWTDALSKTVKTGGRKMRWSPQDAYILIHKLTALDVRDDTEIDWKLLPDPVWNLWSPHTLQRRWLTMKRGIKGWEDMTHQEIMDILRARKAHIPPPAPPRKKRERRIISAIAVIEEALAQFPDEVSGSVAVASGSEPAIAGSSSEPAVASSAGPGSLPAENDDDTSSSSDSE